MKKNNFARISWSGCLAALFLALGSVTSALPAVTSTFDTDAEGWVIQTISDGPPYNLLAEYPVYWGSTEGLSGGGIYSADVGSGGYFFSAPSKFLGNKMDYLGKCITFDIKNSVANYEGGSSTLNMFLFGAGLKIWYKGSYPTVAYQWKHVEVPLWYLGWFSVSGDPITETSFLTVMADLQGVYIKADWGWGADASWLDNVKMGAAPVPTSVLLFGSGLVGLVGLRRKFKKSG